VLIELTAIHHIDQHISLGKQCI